MADPYESVTVTNYNANPPADDGTVTEANRLKWSTIKTKITDTLKTAIEAINTNVAAAFGKVDGGITSTAISYTVLEADQGKLVRASASGITLTTPDAAGVGAPFVFGFLNDSSGDITLDGSGSQTIDGDATVTVPAGTGGRLRTDGTNWFTEGQNFQSVILNLLTGYLSGLTLFSTASSATFSVGPGVAMDAAGGGIMTLTPSFTNKTTSAWAVGSGNGALDTGTIANSTWYHVWLIKRVDTGVVDVLVSLSVSAPTMPANYTLKRRIGSMKTNGSAQWVQFTQTGDTFIWAAVVADANATGANSNSARTTITLTVPTGVVVAALFRAEMTGVSSSSSIVFSSLQESDQSAELDYFMDIGAANGGFSAASFERLTNTSAQIAWRTRSSGATFCIGTFGWKDTRGK